MNLELVLHIACKRIAGQTYVVIYPPEKLREAELCIALWCLDDRLNFNERAFTEMSREMEAHEGMFR